MEYKAKSYTDINAAYLGFNYLSRGFVVNDYSPVKFSGQIKVIPGTQT
jgi:hypothetical protein